MTPPAVRRASTRERSRAASPHPRRAAQAPGHDARPRGRPGAGRRHDRVRADADDRRPDGGRSRDRDRAARRVAATVVDRCLRAHRGRLRAHAQGSGHRRRRALGPDHAGLDPARDRSRERCPHSMGRSRLGAVATGPSPSVCRALTTAGSRCRCSPTSTAPTARSTRTACWRPGSSPPSWCSRSSLPCLPRARSRASWPASSTRPGGWAAATSHRPSRPLDTTSSPLSGRSSTACRASSSAGSRSSSRNARACSAGSGASARHSPPAWIAARCWSSHCGRRSTPPGPTGAG